MTDLLLHPKTADRTAAVISHPPQGLLITGDTGSGKETLARHIAADILGLSSAKLASYPYLHVLDSGDDAIKIESIRELQQFLKLKVPTTKPGVQRAVIILNAGRMRTEAQNALLKTLEEPPDDTSLILTAESPQQLLETIRSRCQELAILPVGLTQAKEFYAQQGIPAAKLQSAYALSMGQAGLLQALLHNEEHPLRAQVELAKAILGEPVGKRLYRVDALAKDKPGIRMLLNALGRIAHAAVSAASQQDKSQAVAQWHKRQSAILQAKEDLSRNANTKLLLCDLFLQL